MEAIAPSTSSGLPCYVLEHVDSVNNNKDLVEKVDEFLGNQIKQQDNDGNAANHAQLLF